MEGGREKINSEKNQNVELKSENQWSQLEYANADCLWSRRGQVETKEKRSIHKHKKRKAKRAEETRRLQEKSAEGVGLPD